MRLSIKLLENSLVITAEHCVGGHGEIEISADSETHARLINMISNRFDRCPIPGDGIVISHDYYEEVQPRE